MNNGDDHDLKEKIQSVVTSLESDLLFEESSGDVKSQSFLLVMQTIQQQKWLSTYGNTVTCMDAIYKTNKYAFPCFFLVVKTSICIGRVVGTIIPQFETTEMICKGIKTIQGWNPSWHPKFFMTDKSSAELEAIGIAFPTCTCFICDFHRSQAFDRWVNKGCHEVPHHLKKSVMDNFKMLAYASTSKLQFLHGLKLACFRCTV